MESEKAKFGSSQTYRKQKKRPYLCQFIDKGPIEIKTRVLEVPLIYTPERVVNRVTYIKLALLPSGGLYVGNAMEVFGGYLACHIRL